MTSRIYIVLILFLLGCTNKELDSELPILASSWIDDNGNEVAYRPPSFKLTDQHNNTFSSKQLKGKVHVVDFFFSSCPTICPKMTNHMKVIQDHFSDNEGLTLISFSIDPTYDDPERLNAYAESYGINYKQWKLLNDLNKETVFDLSKEYKVRAFEELFGEERNLVHDGTFVLMDEQGRVRGYYDGLDKESVDQLIEDIEILL